MEYYKGFLSRSAFFLLAVFSVLLTSHTAFGIVELPVIFTDGMVLQRDRPVRIWGWAAPGEKISIVLKRQYKTVVADAKGNWSLKLSPERAGGPYELVIKGTNTILLKDIYFGDVWICAGQSNMEFNVRRSMNAAQEIAAANFPLIRHFKVPEAESFVPADTLPPSRWTVCSPKTVADFSAVGFFFARELVRELGIPIGIIKISKGGANIENFISPEAFIDNPSFADLNAVLKEKILADTAEAESWINMYPGLLFNGMINPIIPLSIKGVVWYQGEANIGRSYEYRKMLTLLIQDWRARWGVGEFPFYIVQLPGFKGNGGSSNSGSKWAELRESQQAVLALPNTGLVVTTDVGDPNDLHPKNKREVGRRLAALALTETYGKQYPYRGPAFKSMEIKDNKIRITFQHAEDGLTSGADSLLTGFEVIGTDGIFYPATAWIEQNQVIVFNESVPTPKQVRYCWFDDTSRCNLYNKEGLPAPPFRSDKRPAVTEKIKYRVKQPVQPAIN